MEDEKKVADETDYEWDPEWSHIFIGFSNTSIGTNSTETFYINSTHKGHYTS